MIGFFNHFIHQNYAFLPFSLFFEAMLLKKYYISDGNANHLIHTEEKEPIKAIFADIYQFYGKISQFHERDLK